MIAKLSNIELLNKTKLLVKEETHKTLEVLHHLREVDRRRLYLKISYPSLFEYCVHELKYSHSAAFRRVEAMRLLRDLPEVEAKILKGSINLTTASQVQGFFKKQISPSPNAQTKSITNKADKLDLIQKLENKSTREVQKELINLNPDLLPKEKLRPIGQLNSFDEQKYELKVVIDESLKAKLDKLKSLMSHKNPNFNYQELITKLADQALKKLDLVNKQPTKLQRKALPAAGSKSDNSENSRAIKHSRYIPAYIKQQIWQRDQGQCQYKDPLSQRQCKSTHFIQIDHITPFSQQGSSLDINNLRLLCGNHNRWRHAQDV
ncbi:MAG: HNH endonuclease [Oligoflexia bacterium]|nr:HNH endonuclease [Oligoflexia bacterium]